MRRLVIVGVAALVCVLSVSATASAKPSLDGKSASCTPKAKPIDKGRWIDVKGTNKQYKLVMAYPKNSGRIAVGGFCHVLRKGLGKIRKVYRVKPVKMHDATPPAPPATVVGNPLPVVVTPVTTPVVTPPVAPPVITNPVNPPSNPTPTPTPQYSCSGLTVRQPNGSGVMRATVLYTASNGAVFDHATLYPGTGTPGGDKLAITSLNPGFTYTYDGSQSSYFASATVTFRLPDGSMVTTEIDPDTGPSHCSAFVSVPLPSFVCGGPGIQPISGLNPAGPTATIGAHYTALNRAQFRGASFVWGDGSSNTTQASSNSEADFAHIYPGPGDYPIEVTFAYSVPFTQALQNVTCMGWVHIPAPV